MLRGLLDQKRLGLGQEQCVESGFGVISIEMLSQCPDSGKEKVISQRRSAKTTEQSSDETYNLHLSRVEEQKDGKQKNPAIAPNMCPRRQSIKLGGTELF